MTFLRQHQGGCDRGPASALPSFHWRPANWVWARPVPHADRRAWEALLASDPKCSQHRQHRLRSLQIGRTSHPAATACRAAPRLPQKPRRRPSLDRPRTRNRGSPDPCATSRLIQRVRQARGQGVDRGENHMRRHHPRQIILDEESVRPNIGLHSTNSRRSTGNATWESAITAPWPGKCFAAAAIPASRMPRLGHPEAATASDPCGRRDRR